MNIRKSGVVLAMALMMAPLVSQADQPMGQDGGMMKDDSMKMDKPKTVKKEKKAKTMYKCPMDGTIPRNRANVRNAAWKCRWSN